MSVHGELGAETSRQPPTATGRPNHGAGNDSFIGQLEQPALIVANCRTHGRAKPRVHTCRLGRLHHQPVGSRPVELPAGTLSGKHAVPLAGNFIGPHRNKRTNFQRNRPRRTASRHQAAGSSPFATAGSTSPGFGRSCLPASSNSTLRGCIVANASPDVVAAERDRLSELAGQNANLKIALARISEAG
ncbi:hypothetical protein [Mesorhizobium sp. LNJC394B00]|uniref:hypothetical protein n=1 Tax=Mesorhizobium sp. LNJC394B00 TaxID=1287274 RepID=UPI0018DB9707|nr:hypothetical protein [Mesorhizobium sp. LNJC394B00]